MINALISVFSYNDFNEECRMKTAKSFIMISYSLYAITDNHNFHFHNPSKSDSAGCNPGRGFFSRIGNCAKCPGVRAIELPWWFLVLTANKDKE